MKSKFFIPLCFLFLSILISSTSFADLSPLQTTASKLAQNFIFQNAAQSLVWDWRGSIFNYGLIEFAKTLPEGKEKNQFLQYVIDYHENWEKTGIPAIDHSDHCPSALSLLALQKLKVSSLSYVGLEKVAQYIRTQKRNDLGALDHLGSLPVYPHSMWVDSLMMYALFAVQYGSEKPDPALRDFGASQVSIFAKALQDPDDHLFRHARYEHDQSYLKEMKAGQRPEVLHEIYDLGGSVLPHERAYWLRGNSWVLVSAAEMLDALPDHHPARAEILKVFLTESEAILKYQHASGMWGTLINLDSYEESSGTALVAYALAHAVHKGDLNQNPTLKAKAIKASVLAYQGLLKNLVPTAHGLSLTHNSKGTEPFPPEVYLHLPQVNDATYGVGGFLMLSSELTAKDFNL